MAVGADGVDRPELLALSCPLTAGGGVSVLSSEAGANTGTRAGDIGRISGCSGSGRRASCTVQSVTGTAGVNVGLRTEVENGLKVGVAWRCSSLCCCCCSTMRSAGRRAGDGCGVDSRSRNFTNSSENDCRQTTTPATQHTHTHIHTHTHTHTLSATTLVGRRNIHPLTPILFIRHSLSTSSIYYDPQHPPCLLGNSHVARCRSQKVPKQHFKQFQSSKQCTGGFMVPTDSQGITSYISVFQQNRWNRLSNKPSADCNHQQQAERLHELLSLDTM